MTTKDLIGSDDIEDATIDLDAESRRAFPDLHATEFNWHVEYCLLACHVSQPCRRNRGTFRSGGTLPNHRQDLEFACTGWD